MPGFEDSAVIILLALLLFGPKKLPELARQLGKLMADFRRASSEFRTQMEDELRISEQAERQKQLAASPASVPPANTVSADAAPETPLIDAPIEAAPVSSADAPTSANASGSEYTSSYEQALAEAEPPAPVAEVAAEPAAAVATDPTAVAAQETEVLRG